jgi:hypothetical protein
VDDYRNPDSLVFLAGTYRMEKAWEDVMLGHWTFDEKRSGSADGATAHDYSGAGHDGTINGGTWCNGKWNGGLTFDGTDDSVAIGTASTFDAAMVFTIMAWVKKNGTSETNALIFGMHNPAAGEGYRLNVVSDKLRIKVYNVEMTGSTPLGTDWRHVAVTFHKHSGRLKLFVDGKLEFTSYEMTYPMTSTTPVSIGNGFTGIIDDVRFYGTELSEETVRSISQNGYRPHQGLYMLRATNNNTMHLQIDGTATVPRRFPIFQIANYYASAAPKAVYYHNSWQSTTANYIAGFNDADNMVTVGFNKRVTTPGLRVYIDDTDSSGAFMVGPMPRMYWGSDANGFYVKNTSSTSFGESGSNEFYLYWKMAATGGKDGEISEFKSSEVNALTTIASATNLIPTNDTSGTFGYYHHYTTSYSNSAKDVTATPTYEVIDSSGTRVKFIVKSRTVDGTDLDYNVSSVWTIYPVGQIFRYDTVTTIVNASNKIDIEVARWRLATAAGGTSYVRDSVFAGGGFNYTSSKDFVVCLAGSGDNTGSTPLFNDQSDTVAWEGLSATIGPRWYGTKDRTTSNQPFRYAWYVDIRDNNMTANYMDSVVNGVRRINFTVDDMITGTRLNNTHGDINGDGFNESEGTYTIQASGNSVNFILQADGANNDRCKFYPALRITNYYAANKPKYVHLYTAADTVRLLDGYGYNCYLNDASDVLLVQLDTVLCTDTKIYISCDDDLAVTLSDFFAKAADENDTLFWHTESEKDNLGFFLYRRIKPVFLDNLNIVVDSIKDEELLDNAGVLLKQGTIGYQDTTWVKVNSEIIPGAQPGEIPGIPRDYKLVDWEVCNDVEYEYKLYSVNKDKSEKGFGPIYVIPRPIFPKRFFLFHNFPNPVRFYTNIRFDLPKKTKVSLYVYNLQGRLITRIIRPDKVMKPGFYRIRWDCRDEQGRQLASGPYIYRIVASKYAKARMMILVK